MIKKKPISIFLILLSLMILFSSCNSLNVINKIKAEPKVLDVGINIGETLVDVEVILKTDTETKDINELAQKCKAIVKNEYKDKEIIVRMKTNAEEWH